MTYVDTYIIGLLFYIASLTPKLYGTFWGLIHVIVALALFVVAILRYYNV